MASDATTFFLGFAALFGALGWYLWHLERKVDDMRRRLDAVAPRRPPRVAGGTSPRPRDAPQMRGEHPQRRTGAGGPSGRDGADATPKKEQPEGWP